MTLTEFSKLSNVKEETILKRLIDIKGCKLIDGDLSFSSGTRYPCKTGLRIKDPADKYYAILYAIGHNRYIDNRYIGVDTETFSAMLEELTEIKYIVPINVENHIGANAYAITILGSNMLAKNKNRLINELAQALGTFSGTALAAYCN